MSAPPVVELKTRPWRHYVLDGQTHVDGVKIASVTQVLGVIDKSGPLQHYAAQKTLEGVCALAKQPPKGGASRVFLDGPDAVKEALKKRGLMYWQRTNEAANRGTAIHQALEAWALHGEVPNPAKVRESWRGYMAGLAKWLATEQPEFLETERAVGSRRLAVAGTRDTVVRIKAREGTILADLKTSKRAYDTHHIQLAAYELLGCEMGEPEPDSRMVVVVKEDGTYEVTPSPPEITTAHFEAVVRMYRAMEEVKAACK